MHNMAQPNSSDKVVPCTKNLVFYYSCASSDEINYGFKREKDSAI
jgi:hypothetical protein